MIILSFYRWDVGEEGSCVVRVLVVVSFELCSIYFSWLDYAATTKALVLNMPFNLDFLCGL